MKKLYLFIAFIFLLLSIFTIITLVSNHGKNVSPIQTFPTPTPITTQAIQHPSQPLYVTATQPLDNVTDVPVNQAIIITFNKTISEKDFTFRIQPSVDYTTRIQGQNFIVIPKSPLTARGTYQYFIDYTQGGQPDIHYFTTAGTGQVFPNNNSNFKSVIDNADIKYAPDVYLSNQIESNNNTNPDFSITYDYTETPVGHFFFTVTLNGSDQNQSKQEFLDWLQSLGLQDQQIQQLDIQYE